MSAFRKLLDRLAELHARSAVRERLARLMSIVPALWVCRLLWRETPLSYDHAAHLFKAWHFWEEQLKQGRLRGWSHYWGFGFPSDELVPLGSEVWVALFRALSFGQLSWVRTYALSFAGLLVFKSFAAYVFARGYLSRSAAVICAWITLLDPGGMLEGGWTWHTYWGVWPVTLAVSFGLLALARLERALSLGRRRDALWAGLWFAASLLTHPLALPMFALLTPVLFLDHLLRPNRLTLPRAARGAAALALGLMLSSSYLLPFLARTHQSQDLGWLGDSLPVVSQRLFGFEIFQNVWRPIHALALLGTWFALRQLRRGGVFLSLSALLLVVLSSGTLLRDLHLERVMPSLIKLEANRFLLIAKLFWFPLAAHALVQLCTQSYRRLRWAGARPWQRLLALGPAGALALWLLAPGAKATYEAQIAKDVVGESERKLWPELSRVWEWTKVQRASSSEHYRIAYNLWRGEHLSTMAPVLDGALMFKIGYTPVQIFDKFPMTGEPELLAALSVKYVVSSSRLDQPAFALERKFGALSVYRFTGYQPDPFSFNGPGRGELLEFSPERVRIRLWDTSAESRLKLHVASFERWRARIAGVDVPISTATVFGPHYPILMEVPARDGELTLEYVYRGVDWLGLCVTLFAFPLVAAAGHLAQRHAVYERLGSAALRFRRALIATGAALGLAVAIFCALGTRSRIKLLPPSSVFHQLRSGELSLGGQTCELRAPLSFECGPHRVRAEVVAGVWGLHGCMQAPDDAGALRSSFQARLGRFLLAHYDPKDKAAGSLQVKVAGTDLGRVETRPAYLREQHLQFDTRAHASELTQLDIEVAGAALMCFDFEIVP